MALFCQEIYRVVNTGLAELAQSQLAGKTPANPLSETHFFSAWVTKSLKQHRFERNVIVPLTAWQRQARTQGVQANLKQQFIAIERLYATIVDDDEQSMAVNQTQLDEVVAQLTTANWQVTTDVTVGRKLSIKSSGQSSLVICAKLRGSAFDSDGQLTKPMSLFVRGEVQWLIDLCHRHNLLLHKMTDYKSAVKYHGEYIIYPLNNGLDLPCVTSS